MVAELWVLLVVGVMIGFWLGRRWAECARARYDMRAIWNGRRRYRGK